MPKFNEDAYRKGPLLIKIEACPKSGKTEPCSEECTRVCEKTYTIFDPKPPRKKSKDSSIEPESKLEVETSNASLKSPSKSSSIKSVKSRSTKSSSMSKPESFESRKSSLEGNAESPELSPELPVVDEEIEQSRKSSIKLEEPPSNFIERNCFLEICVLEKHDENCRYRGQSDGTEDATGDSRVIARQLIKMCHPSTPRPKEDAECLCEKSTEVNMFASCPICSQCPCHSKGKTMLKIPAAIYTKPSSETESIRSLSEPETYIESVASSEGAFITGLPDFRSIPIRHPPALKRRSSSAFLVHSNIRLKGDDRDEEQFLRTMAVSPSGPGAEEVFKSSKCFSMSSAGNESVLSPSGDLGEVIRGCGLSGSTLKDEAKALANTSADCS
ncbi:hypothetical protein HHI36_015603 [Cryptolaemus montrouzieri]|uniref:Uncharacterized protein n=1 Tax=Cryptolaemus montrouzieri TaxID=559131 RepID=A0ABD2N619_9CUCU